MKDIWRERFRKKASNPDIEDFEVLTGFNANIDRIIRLDELDWSLEDIEPQNLEEVSDTEDIKKVLAYAVKNGVNLEVDASEFNSTFDEGDLRIGGQAGIMANYLSNMEGSVTFYTPFLSQQLADLMDEKVLHPYFDEEFSLKNVRDSANTDRTKENIIIEFSKPKSGRLILSDNLKGFGPYFRSGIEENIELIDSNIQGALLSGFHNVDGNKTAKLEKAKRQLSKIESTTHLELVDMNKEMIKSIGSKIMPEVESIGMDETEALNMADTVGKDFEKPLHLGEAFELLKLLISETELDRCHLHTYRYHLTVTEEGYEADLDTIQNGMLFGEISAIKSAELGGFPEYDDFDGLSFENKHVKNLDEFEDLQDFFNLDNFVESGKALIDGFKVVVIPTVIHENPKRLVGMGDLISAGAFAYELSKVNEL